jgi:hypothetical protein
MKDYNSKTYSGALPRGNSVLLLSERGSPSLMQNGERGRKERSKEGRKTLVTLDTPAYAVRGGAQF